ncbi:hypothetical protein HYR54_00500 [Candidatus Acetothermia bacterium]|nr:hypothetical protein [Candidatus Acetothermia bacterium]
MPHRRKRLRWIKIGLARYELRWTIEGLRDGEEDGLFDPVGGTIKLHPELRDQPAEAFYVLVHELLHALIYTYGPRMSEAREEDLVTRWAMPLAEALVESGLVNLKEIKL